MMKKDVNLIFFGLLILLLIAMVGVMLYSDYTYHKVNVQYMEFKIMYEDAQKDLNETRAELNARDLALQEKEQALLDTIKKLNLSEQQGASISGYYEEIKTEKEELSEELSSAEDERDKWKNSYESTKTELNVCNTNYALKKTEVSRLEGVIVNADSDIAAAINLAEVLYEYIDDLDCDDAAICAEQKNQNITDTLEDLQGKLQTIDEVLGSIQ